MGTTAKHPHKPANATGEQAVKRIVTHTEKTEYKPDPNLEDSWIPLRREVESCEEVIHIQVPSNDGP